jgi:hypothetical protein
MEKRAVAACNHEGGTELHGRPPRRDEAVTRMARARRWHQLELE